ncbi:MAG: VanW family protein [Myxococcales bacterium]|nr:VanW family protein [Myxococcales bacterium]
MRRVYRILLRLSLAGSLVGGAALAAERYVDAQLPRDGEVAEGLYVDGVAVGRGERVDDVVARRVAARLERRIELHDGARLLQAATVGELGGEVDAEALRAAVGAVAHEGPVLRRLDEAAEARAGRRAVALRVRLPVEALAATVTEYKAERDEPAVPSRWDFARGVATEHRDAALADAFAAVEAVERALASAPAGDAEAPLRVELPFTHLPPAATREAVASVVRSTLLLRRETVFGFGGGQAGRAQNVARAARGVDGAVLMPGEVVSFNQLVGPRSLDNGFALAGEIYRGEMRTGVGGGTCQVASTLYSTAYLAGLDIVARSPHSRPIGYLPAGLDATVAYPHIDLKLRNGFDFPIVVHARAEQGKLTFELWGRERPAEVSFESATVRTMSYKRKVTEAPGLEAGKVVQKKKGIRGLVVKKVRHIKLRDGDRDEETKDIYPPSDEEFLVGPGTDPDKDLPPLPGSETPGAAPAAAADGPAPLPPGRPG